MSLQVRHLLVRKLKFSGIFFSFPLYNTDMLSCRKNQSCCEYGTIPVILGILTAIFKLIPRKFWGAFCFFGLLKIKFKRFVVKFNLIQDSSSTEIQNFNLIQDSSSAEIPNFNLIQDSSSAEVPNFLEWAGGSHGSCLQVTRAFSYR